MGSAVGSTLLDILLAANAGANSLGDLRLPGNVPLRLFVFNVVTGSHGRGVGPVCIGVNDCRSPFARTGTVIDRGAEVHIRDVIHAGVGHGGDGRFSTTNGTQHTSPWAIDRLLGLARLASTSVIRTCRGGSVIVLAPLALLTSELVLGSWR